MFIEISEELASNPWFKPEALVRNPNFLPEMGNGLHHWAVLVEQKESILAVFYGDARGVFDEIIFATREDAVRSLARNGFSRHIEDSKARELWGPPRGKFHKKAHPKGPIYSSGKYWK